MSYIIQVQDNFLILRFVQLGLAVISLIVDIALIALISHNDNNSDAEYVVTYGPCGYGIWLAIFTLVIVLFSIRTIKANHGIPYHVLRLILEIILVLKWFSLFIYAAASASNISGYGLGSIVGASAVLAVVSAIQWIICVTVLTIFIKCWRRSRAEYFQPTQISATPGKLEHNIPPGPQPAQAPVYVYDPGLQGYQQPMPGNTQIYPQAHPQAYPNAPTAFPQSYQ